MNTFQASTNAKRRRGFTLVEVLVVITIIGILAGLLTVAVQRALITAQEFAVKNEMSQLEAAIEKFNIDNGFYPPSFKNMDADTMLRYLSRIAPNNAEAQVVGGTRRIDTWWSEVGDQLADTATNPGADLVFWLSGLSKDKQFPLTFINGMGNVEGLAAHNAATNENLERDARFEFDSTRLNVTGKVATYSQSDRKSIPYQYLDARNYLPAGPMDEYIAYCRPGFSDMDYEQIEDGTLEFGSPLFKELYPNHDTFQLISLGLDGMPGMSEVPNRFNDVGIEGRDNFVNFGGTGPTKLETVILELN